MLQLVLQFQEGGQLKPNYLPLICSEGRTALLDPHEKACILRSLSWHPELSFAFMINDDQTAGPIKRESVSEHRNYISINQLII